MAQALNLHESYVVFELAGAFYGLRSDLIQQMEMLERITPVPNAPAYVEGVTLSRGKMIPAVNLRARFGFEKSPHTVKSRLMVVRAAGRTVGLIVDSAREFIPIPADLIKPPPETIAGLSGTYLKGIATIGERLVLVLNAEDILNSVDPALLSPDPSKENPA